MDSSNKLPEPYEEVFIWWNNNGTVVRRVARLNAERKYFQLSTYLADTKGQYTAPLEKVERWEPIVGASPLIAAAPKLLKVLQAMNHMGGDVRGGYCICPLHDGSAPDEQHASVCADARAVIRKTTGQ